MLTGSIVALITPMHEDGRIDFPSLTGLIDWHINEGSDGILILGTTGESPTLTEEEKRELIEVTVTHVNKRVPVIVGTGTNCTATSIKNTQLAQGLGADAALLVTPYYNKPTQEGMFKHFASIAESCHINQILYNNPARTNVDLLPETVSALQQFDYITGIKECVGGAKRLAQLKEASSSSFNLLSGDDPSAFEFIQAGGHGVISVAANVAPALMHDMSHALLDSSIADAQALSEKLNVLFDALGAETNPIPVKWAVAALGRCPQGIRLPLTPLSKPAQKVIQNVLNQLELTTQTLD